MDTTALVTNVGRCIILVAQLEEVLQDLAYELQKGSGATRSDVSGKSGDALIKQLGTAGLKAWVARYASIALGRNTLAHSIWFGIGQNREDLYARRSKPRGASVGDVIASSWSDDRFAEYVNQVETALVDAVNDLWRAADLPPSFIYTRENLPV